MGGREGGREGGGAGELSEREGERDLFYHFTY